MTSDKIGFNVIAPAILDAGLDPFNPPEWWTWKNDHAAGLWLPDKGEPDSRILGRYADVRCRWLKYGNSSNKATLIDMIIHKFTIMDFLGCCQTYDIKPIITLPIFQPPEVSASIINYIRNRGYAGILCAEIGSEPWWGTKVWSGGVPDGVDPMSLPVVEYVNLFNAIYNAIDKTNVKIGVPLFISERGYWPIEKEWDTIVLNALTGKMDWGSLHLYANNSVQLNQWLAMAKDYPVDMIVTEWSPSSGGDAPAPIHEWARNADTLECLRIFESHPKVIAHTLWESSCGGDGWWSLFEKDGTPLPAWYAYETFARSEI